MKKTILFFNLFIIIGINSNSNAQIGRFKTTQYGHTLVGYNTDWWGLGFGPIINGTKPCGTWNIQLYGQSYPKSLNFGDLVEHSMPEILNLQFLNMVMWL